MGKIRLQEYEGEHQLNLINQLIESDLSEPYSIYTYRYFLHAWPQLTLLVCHLSHRI
jgi:peptide alpha-N-acetyltransferase